MQDFPIEYITTAIQSGVAMLIEYGKEDKALEFIAKFTACGEVVNYPEKYLAQLGETLKELEVELRECLK